MNVARIVVEGIIVAKIIAALIKCGAINLLNQAAARSNWCKQVQSQIY